MSEFLCCGEEVEEFVTGDGCAVVLADDGCAVEDLVVELGCAEVYVVDFLGCCHDSVSSL